MEPVTPGNLSPRQIAVLKEMYQANQFSLPLDPSKEGFMIQSRKGIIARSTMVELQRMGYVDGRQTPDGSIYVVLTEKGKSIVKQLINR